MSPDELHEMIAALEPKVRQALEEDRQALLDWAAEQVLIAARLSVGPHINEQLKGLAEHIRKGPEQEQER